jgi:hypothetical protein
MRAWAARTRTDRPRQARRLSVRVEGGADPRRAAHLRQGPRGGWNAISCRAGAGAARQGEGATPRCRGRWPMISVSGSIRSIATMAAPGPGPRSRKSCRRSRTVAQRRRHGRAARTYWRRLVDGETECPPGRDERAVLEGIETRLSPGGACGERRSRAAGRPFGRFVAPAPPARPPAGGSTCCRRGAISTRSTAAPCPRPPPGRWGGNRRTC